MTMAPSGDEMRYHSEFVAGDSFLGKQRVTWSTWYLQDSVSGVYGDPTVATAETGRVIMDAAVKHGAEFLREYRAHRGQLE
jgi:creatinine amidohydrolase/Fe(II)-dependent formamide hydrolase-like protein